LRASRFKRENADDVVDRTIKGMLSSKLLTPEQAESKIASRQLLRVPYSIRFPPSGATGTWLPSIRGSPSRGSIRAADLGLGGRGREHRSFRNAGS
jgi:hypothetical protein